jgi:hypothetical protein
VHILAVERLFALGDDDTIKKELSRLRPDDLLVEAMEAVLGAMRGREEALPALANSDHDDAYFLRQLWSLRALVGPTGALRPGIRLPRIRTAGVCYDFIDKTCQQPWSIAKLLNFVALCRIKPTRRAAVVATMRNDGTSLLEFVAHYRAAGFEHIYIYSNDNADGTSELLSLLAEHGIITYINNPISRDTSPQRKAFEHSLHFLVDLRDYEWVFYADSDELLIPGPQFGFDINAVLYAVAEAHPNNLPSAICYWWKWYGGHTFHRDPGLQLDRFQYSRMDEHFKSLVRLSEVMSMRPLHYPICKNKSFLVNSVFAAIALPGASTSPVNTDGGWVNHYWHKSFEEYCVKRTRGEALDMDPKRNEYRRDDQQYFSWNVPRANEFYDPSPMEVVTRVRMEYERLLALPGVRVINDGISDGFPGFLRSLVDTDDLRRRFDALARQHPKLQIQLEPMEETKHD